jgi:hypothetical protein
MSRSRSENHIADTCTAQRMTVYLTNLVKILHGTNISEQISKEEKYFPQVHCKSPVIFA